MPDIDFIISQYIQGKSSEEENHLLLEWLKESPENRKRLFSEKDIWDTYDYHADLKSYPTDSELEILKLKLKTEIFTYNSLFGRFIQIAAILLVVFGLGWATRYLSFNKPQPVLEATIQEIAVPKGQVNQVFLADGTRIWINSQSKVIIPSIFASNERVIQLTGEAYFEVARDATRPFKVEVKGQRLEVLGTTFNIRAYPNHKEIQTTLSEGKVKLFTQTQQAILNPGEQSSYDQETRKLTITLVNPSNFNSWKDGRFEFQNEDLVEVFKVVERWYDVEIKYNEKDFKGMHFSGVIKRNKDVNHFLNLLNHTIPIRYQNNFDKITITRQ